jgi:hypothetical protein
MPSLTFAAHARAAMSAQGGGTILKPSGLNSVVETNRSDSSKAAVPAASAARKSAVGLDNGVRKKTAACPATVTVCFSSQGYRIISLTFMHIIFISLLVSQLLTFLSDLIGFHTAIDLNLKVRAGERNLCLCHLSCPDDLHLLYPILQTESSF